MKGPKSHITPTIHLLLRIYLLALGVFFSFRLLLLLTEISRVSGIDRLPDKLFTAFLIGVRFDLAIIGYITLLPALILLLLAVMGKRSSIVNRILFYYFMLLFTFSFVIAAADIPYFNQFFKRFDIGAFEWMDSPRFVLKMIFREPRYYLAFLPFFLLTYFFYRGMKRVFSRYEMVDYRERGNILAGSLQALLILGLIFLGIRGRIQKKSPIRVGTAYFCSNPMLNQLGLNPVFTLMRSALDAMDEDNATVSLMDSGRALEYVQNALHLSPPPPGMPLARTILTDTVSTTRTNVVLIIMEGMSAAKMAHFGNRDTLTPFLDSLADASLFFDHIYTAGEHTFNGIFSTLFSYPALFRQHPLKGIVRYHGISHALKKQGYTTTYFTTHDGQFDNVEGFLRANDFDNIVSEDDYPKREVKTTLGVPDDYMFRFSIPYLNNLHRTGKPFFVAFMTASDHGPYYIPGYYQPRHGTMKQQATAYADWSLRRFFTLAKRQGWFDHTIFVFVADHGAPLDVHYPLSLNYHHSPLLFHTPPNIHLPETRHDLGSQIDVFPTIMGLLRLPYINETMGMDLLRERRPYALLNGDDKVAAIDREWLFVLKGQDRWLFRHPTKNPVNYLDSFPVRAKEMETYLRAHLQVYQDLLIHDNTAGKEDQ